MRSPTSQLVPYASALSIALWVVPVVAFVTSAQDTANTEKSKKDAVDEKAIQKLVVELGDESFDKREAAYKRLAELGTAVLPALEKVSKESTDAELRERALELIARISSNALDGVWNVVSIEIGGKKMRVGKGSPDKLVIDKGKMTILAEGKPFAIFQDREYKTDSRKSPSTMDIVIAERGYTVPGIYELKGADLKVAIPRAPASSDVTLERPRSFETKEHPVLLLITKKNPDEKPGKKPAH